MARLLRPHALATGRGDGWPVESRGLTHRSKDAVEAVYTGNRGESYADTVLAADDRTLGIISANRARKLRNHLSQSDRVLEIGVGYGTNLWHLDCRKKVGFDIGNFGRNACEAHGIRFVTDFAQLTGEKFSVVLMHHMLEHVPAPLDTLERARDLLEPGGRLLVYVPNDVARHARRFRQDDPNHHLYSWSPLTLANLVSSAGFRVHSVRTQPFGFERYLAPLAQVNVALYRATLWVVQKLYPNSEIQLVAELPDGSTDPGPRMGAGHD